jgi:hypothetical protein
MKAYDVSFIDKFYEAEKIEDYDELIAYFRCQKPSSKIHLEKHDGVLMPLFFHFKAHLILGRNGSIKDYVIANKIISNKHASFICEWFPSLAEECSWGKCKIKHLNTGKKYNSIVEASRDTGFSYWSIRQVLIGERKQNSGQFWSYEDISLEEAKASWIKKGWGSYHRRRSIATLTSSGDSHSAQSENVPTSTKS